MVGIKDEPNIEKDGLGVQPYAVALAKFIKQSETPMTIGVQGPWGSGKTSLLFSVWEEIKQDDKMAQIWVNSWEHSLMSSSEETLIKITTEIANKIVEFDDKQKQASQVKKITGKLLMGSLTAGAALTAGAKAADLVNDLLSDENQTPIKQLKNELQTSVNRVFDRKTNEKKRFIIFIDDLDRIEPSDAVSLLELLKNIFSVDHCVFVLAIDYDVVIKGLSKKFGEKNSQNEREYKAFFDKVIQLTFKMPMSNYDIGNYVYNLLDKTQFISDLSIESQELKEFFQKIIALTVKGNPRSIKRLVNSLTLMTITAEQIEIGDKKSVNKNHEKQLLFALVCLQISFPEIYNIVAIEPDFVTWNEDLLSEQIGLFASTDEFEKIFANATELEEFDEEWEQILFKFGYFKGYSIAEITNCSRFLNSIKVFDTELLNQVVKRTSVTSVGNAEASNIQQRVDPIYTKIWENLFSYMQENFPNIDIPEQTPKKSWTTFKRFKNGWKVGITFKKTTGEIFVILHNMKSNISKEDFVTKVQALIADDPEFNIEILEERKRMDVLARKSGFDNSSEQSEREAFEWVCKKLSSVLNSSKTFE